MEVIETKEALTQALQSCRDSRISIGFVPTMGALHPGHISLVEQCRKENSMVVVSIFVNPTQFNDQSDLANYPRTLEEDLYKLSSVGCNYAFAPSVKEMYPEEDTRKFDFGMLDKVMEGVHRPGHFNGVAQIVSRLFDAVQPDKAYFGEKDFQQLAIIRRMVAMMNYPVQIVGCSIVREADGLAMSSRNMRLTPEQRQNVPAIAHTLLACKEKIGCMSLDELKNWVVDRINNTPGLQTEYFDIVDRDSLQPASEYKENALQGCIAVHVGTVRLIDNIRL
ncbi:MAG: pantoate--beta-alanine ligase [Bacteroidales bacterium]|jgi:pantoate--beta-alanine ligase|nr:pantoate--beta-alanine ligase [Bacteroidales bacterium]